MTCKRYYSQIPYAHPTETTIRWWFGLRDSHPLCPYFDQTIRLNEHSDYLGDRTKFMGYRDAFIVNATRIHV